ncbi:hypothetical protein B0H14DRAFT_3463435 [Mycena olivaceomarginata]|nr:hypothetical protein B0H14DRAFT_3463435 [Mycena olivaceomarginata]
MDTAFAASIENTYRVLEALVRKPRNSACFAKIVPVEFIMIGILVHRHKGRLSLEALGKAVVQDDGVVNGCQVASLGNGELSAKDAVDSHNTVGGGGSAKADTKRKATRQPVEDDEDSDDDYAPAKRAAPRKQASPQKAPPPPNLPATPLASTSASTAALLANPVDVIRAAKERLEAQRLSAAASAGGRIGIAIVTSDIAYAQETYGVEVIAVCTDDGPDGKKMRRLIKELTPWIATFECWAHQVHLICSNYLAIKASWMDAAKLAMDVIKFFNHHQTPLDLLRAQEQVTLGHYLALLSPGATRWGSNYCSIRRLKRLQPQIQVTIISHENTIRTCTGRKPEQIAAAEHAISVCKDSRFWENLILRPQPP